MVGKRKEDQARNRKRKKLEVHEVRKDMQGVRDLTKWEGNIIIRYDWGKEREFQPWKVNLEDVSRGWKGEDIVAVE
jgi:hypothetical protein